MTLESLIEFVSQNTIEATYQFLNYDYGAELRYQDAANSAAVGPRCQDRRLLEYESGRQALLGLFCWHDGRPSHQDVLRLFNQINTFYAEQWAMAHLAADPLRFIEKSGELILFKQGKQSGFRTDDILFGIRKDLDFMDPFRGFKFLRGIAPGLLIQVTNIWADVVQTSQRDSDRALILAMALVAAHPFPDGNGRLARVAYSWITRRWGFEDCWLAEDQTGEFLRTGFRLDSTEHLMSALLIELCGGHNRNDFGYRAVRTEQEDRLATQAFERQLRVMSHDDTAILRCEPFILLRNHLLREGHFTPRRPRFEALRQVIK